MIRDEGEPYLLNDYGGLSEKIIKESAEVYHMDIRAGLGQTMTFEFTFDATGFDVASICRDHYDETTLLDNHITIRPVKDDEEEIVAVIACIHSAYGYHYARETLYSPDGFRAQLVSGKYHSYVAVNESGQVLAHASLSEGSSMVGLPDLGALVTKPFCRGLHIAERLVAYILEDAKRLGYRGVRAEPVAFHPYTQKLFCALGLEPTGFLFHELNPETAGVYRDGERRLDLGLAQVLFTPQALREVILPPEHESFLRERFQALNIPIHPFAEDAPPKPGYFHKSIHHGMRLCTIFASGSDWMAGESLTKTQRELACVDNVDLYLDMNNPGSMEAYRRLQKLGFFVTGVVAGASDADYLVMQHFLGSQLDESKVVCEPSYQTILAQVLAHRTRS